MTRAMLGLLLLAATAAAGESPSTLELRPIADDGSPSEGIPIPRSAVRGFLHLGEPKDVAVSEKHIAVDYGLAAVLFDRATGKPIRRATVADGWPKHRPGDLSRLSELPPHHRPRLVGPGVAYAWRGGRESEPIRLPGVEHGGRIWQAVQPGDMLRRMSREGYEGRRREKEGTPHWKLATSWTGILRRLNDECFLEAGPKRYTAKDGLASNIVTHLASAAGTLWAACADIYDYEAEEWGPGGLCRYDAAADRWLRVEEIAGRPVRFVTALDGHGDDLWAAWREGEGVVGDQVYYGMGLYPQAYRPRTTEIVVGRLRDGEWKTWRVPPLTTSEEQSLREPSSEAPRKIAVAGDYVVLFSTVRKRWSALGNWGVRLAGRISRMTIENGRWRAYDAGDLFANRLNDMIVDRGEILVTSSRGVHRWNRKGGWFGRLDPGGELVNPALGAVAPRGEELWVGYTKKAFGVQGRQGITVIDGESGGHRYRGPKEIGTACPVRRICPLEDGSVWVLFRSAGMSRGAAVEWPFFPRESLPSPEGLGLSVGEDWSFPVRGAPFEVPSDIFAAGDRLYARTGGGVFVGPAPWRPSPEGWPNGSPEKLRQSRVEIPFGGEGRWVVDHLDTTEHFLVESAKAFWICGRGQIVRIDRAALEALRNGR